MNTTEKVHRDCAWCGRTRELEQLNPTNGRCVLPDPECVRRLTGGGVRPQPKTVTGVDAWIGNSAQHNLQRENELAARCASSYRTEPYKGAAERLAQAHRQCAAIWQAMLDSLGAAPAPTGDLSPLQRLELELLAETTSPRAYGVVTALRRYRKAVAAIVDHDYSACREGNAKLEPGGTVAPCTCLEDDVEVLGGEVEHIERSPA